MPKKTATTAFSEADMFPPIKAFFASIGYSVNAEVKGCDVALMKNDELLLIELKKSFNITLLYQAMSRKKTASQVYVAIPRPKRVRDKNYHAMLEILKKLEIGLITVAMDSPTRAISIILQPPALPGNKSLKSRDKMLREIGGRSNDTNVGGVTKTKLMTAYREKCIKIACALHIAGKPQTSTELRKRFDCPPDTNTVMKRCTYNWFVFLGNATFELTKRGLAMLEGGEFAEMVEFYRKELTTRGDG